MTERQIRYFGDPVLRSRCDEITVVPGDPRLISLAEDLIDTVRLPGRAGVAANQIGVGLRAFSINVEGTLAYVFNPVLEVAGDPVDVSEGCLSIPDFSFPRRRHPWARVTGVDAEGKAVILEGDGLMAQALQHECDHVDGKLYVEGLEPEVKREAMRQIRHADWFRVA